MKHVICYLSLIVIFLINSCASHEDLVSFNEGVRFPQRPIPINNSKPIRIQPNDILHIVVFSIDPLAAQPFNTTPTGGSVGGNFNRDALQLNGYLVDQEGFIDFPVLGKIKLGGLDFKEAKGILLQNLGNYLKDPVVNLRILNFRVNVLGEVSRPGVYSITNDRLTIIEALSWAGDLTQYGRRDSILLSREIDGQRSFGYVNLNDRNIFESPYFYLQQNDVIYVQPNTTKVNVVRDPAQRVLPWVSALTGVAAFIISIVTR